MSVKRRIKNSALTVAMLAALASPFVVANQNNELRHERRKIAQNAHATSERQTEPEVPKSAEVDARDLEHAHLDLITLKNQIDEGEVNLSEHFPGLKRKILSAKFQYEIPEKEREAFLANPKLKVFAEAYGPKHGIVYVFKDNKLIDADVYVGSPRAYSGNRQVAMDMETPKGLFTFGNNTPSYGGFLGINTSDHAREVFIKKGYESEIKKYEKQHGKIDTYSDQTRFKQWHTQNYPRASMRMYDAIGLHGGGNARPWTYGCLATSNEFIKRLIPKVKKQGLSKVQIMIAPHE